MVAPANDDFANATVITGASGSHAFDLTDATLESGESGPASGTTVWFSWTAPANDAVRFDTAASSGDPDTILTVYTGPNLASLTLIVQDDDSGNDPAVGNPTYGTSIVHFTATASQTYYIQIDGYDPGISGVLTWGHYTPPPPPLTVSSLRGVNAYDPSATFLISFDGQWVYATPDDYWVQVVGVNLDSVTSVTFVKTGEPSINADFNIISPTLLEVKTPYTVLPNSKVRVANGGTPATSVRNVTPIFAGPWLTPPGTINLDNLDYPGDPYQFPTTFQRTLGTTGSKVIGPHDDGSSPAVATYADVVDGGSGSGFAPGAGAAENSIVNGLVDASIGGTAAFDSTRWTVTQAGVRVDLFNLFYHVLADLGVPGYDDTSLLPTGSVAAIPDGTDLGDAFFKDRLTSLTVTATGRNTYPDGYQGQTSYTGPSGTWIVFDPSTPTDAMRTDTLEFRASPAGVSGVPNFQTMSALSSATLLASATINPDPPLRVPAGQELDPVAPTLADPTADVVVDIPALSTLTNGLQFLYTTVFESARTYDDPPDPGQSALLTYTQEGYGDVTIQTLHHHAGSGFLLDAHVRVRATWTPPRYRYFYTEPQPLVTTIPPVRQFQRDDGLTGGVRSQFQASSRQASLRQTSRSTYL